MQIQHRWHKYYCWNYIIIDYFFTVVPKIFGVWDPTMQTETNAKASEQNLSPETNCSWG